MRHDYGGRPRMTAPSASPRVPPRARSTIETVNPDPLSCGPVLNSELARRAAGFGTATCTGARPGRRVARIGTPWRMRGSSWCLLLPHKAGFAGIAGLDAFVRFLLHLLVGLHLLARRRRLLSLCRRGDGNANSGRRGEN